MNHEKDESTDHMNDSRCHYQARFDNRIYTCRVSRSVFPLPLPTHHILLVADPIMKIGAKISLSHALRSVCDNDSKTPLSVRNELSHIYSRYFDCIT